VLATRNFETVIRALRNFTLLAGVYAPGDTNIQRIATEDGDALREVLVRAWQIHIRIARIISKRTNI